jgi:hypothetical protein
LNIKSKAPAEGAKPFQNIIFTGNSSPIILASVVIKAVSSSKSINEMNQTLD